VIHQAGPIHHGRRDPDGPFGALVRAITFQQLSGRSAIARIPDDEIIERLVTVRGIGPWTAEMFLIFELHRLDVWPVDGLGVRQGFVRIWPSDHVPNPRSWRRPATGSARTARCWPVTAGRPRPWSRAAPQPTSASPPVRGARPAR
jgi:3-methyladenine DNA glycosylase/8-oxoguanine DNA glycosylase